MTSLAYGFKRNFDQLSVDEKASLNHDYQDRMNEAASLLDAASECHRAVDAMAERFLKDTVSNVSSRLTPNNYNASADRLRNAISFCIKSGYDVSSQEQAALLEDLRLQYVSVLRRQEEREEQARIKAQIREEQRAEREMQRELERVGAEKAAIERALAIALQETHNTHSAEVQRLQQLLLEAEAKAQLKVRRRR